MNEQPLWQSLLRFYLRVLAVGVAAAALVSLVWSGVLLVRGLPVTVVSVANALFWAGVMILVWVAMSFRYEKVAMGMADSLWTRAPLTGNRFGQEIDTRIRFAWYGGVAGLICLGTAVVLPYLF